jgi:hypothetical protein
MSYNKKYKNLNPEKIKEYWQKASATYKATNPERLGNPLRPLMQDTCTLILEK